MKTTLVLLLLLSATFAQAEPLKIFTYEKSINKENIMIVHTETDSNCAPIRNTTTSTPLVDFYWLMNGKTFKPVNPIIKSNIRERIQSLPTQRSNLFYIDLLELSEVKIDLPESQLAVETFKNAQGKCEARSTMMLGESDENITLVLQTIFVDAKIGLNPFKPKVKSITLKGIDLATGLPKNRTYSAK